MTAERCPVCGNFDCACGLLQKAITPEQSQIRALKERVHRLELLTIACIECLQNSSSWRKASSDYWSHTATENEMELATQLINEYRQ
jgi:hypothetical protein